MDSVRPSTLPRLVSRGIRKGWTWGNCARLQEKKRWVWHNDRRVRALSFFGGGGVLLPLVWWMRPLLFCNDNNYMTRSNIKQRFFPNTRSQSP